MEEFELFEECMYLIGVSEYGGAAAAPATCTGARRTRRPALALDIRGFGRPAYQFLAFPAEEPPSIECNEDAGEEDTTTTSGPRVDVWPNRPQKGLQTADN